MSVIGVPTEWLDFIDSKLPEILSVILTSWAEMPSPASNETEDNITVALCRRLRQNRNARELPFQIHTQLVELDPMAGESLGRLDIAFIPPVTREDMYFCLESKRLNVIKDGELRAYASEYVRFGMMRFVTGQYSKTVRHGGMIGYVLDGRVPEAMSNVEANIRDRHKELCMSPPGAFQASAVLADSRARETHHQRAHETGLFRIHHLFVAAQSRAHEQKETVPQCPDVPSKPIHGRAGQL